MAEDEEDALYERIQASQVVPETWLASFPAPEPERNSFGKKKKEITRGLFGRAVEEHLFQDTFKFSDAWLKPWPISCHERAAARLAQTFGMAATDALSETRRERLRCLAALDRAFAHVTVLFALDGDSSIAARDEATFACDAAALCFKYKDACRDGRRRLDAVARSLRRQFEHNVVDAFLLDDDDDDDDSQERKQEEPIASAPLDDDDDDDDDESSAMGAALAMGKGLKTLEKAATTGALQCRRDAGSIEDAIAAFGRDRRRDAERATDEAIANFDDARTAAMAADDANFGAPLRAKKRDADILSRGLDLVDAVDALCAVERDVAKLEVDSANATSRRSKEFSKRADRLREATKARELKTSNAEKLATAKFQDRRSSLLQAADHLDFVVPPLHEFAEFLTTQLAPAIDASLTFARKESHAMSLVAADLCRLAADRWLTIDKPFVDEALETAKNRAEADFLACAERRLSSQGHIDVHDARLKLDQLRNQISDHEQDAAFFRNAIHGADLRHSPPTVTVAVEDDEKLDVDAEVIANLQAQADTFRALGDRLCQLQADRRHATLPGLLVVVEMV